MSARDLAAFFSAHRNSAAGLVLASVYETLGATYSKTGARMLITGDGQFQGMLSGGCLEGDLAERAAQVAASGQAQQVTYDLRNDDEDLWGLGVGCEGLMRILLQPLRADNDFQPFTDMLTILEGEHTGIALTVIESSDPEVPAGATLTGTGVPLNASDLPTIAAAALAPTAIDALAAGRSGLQSMVLGEHTLTVLAAVLKPPPTILILGAGLDAQPVVRMCVDLGWRVIVRDHRPAYLDKGNFTGAESVLCMPAASLAESLSLNRFDAAVVMSHHLVTDRAYLEQLAGSKIPYIALLGPRTRKDRLMRDLGEQSVRLLHRVHGPAGLDIGGRGPGSIALSILAEMHQVLMRLREEE